MCLSPPGWHWRPGATVVWLPVLSRWQLELGHGGSIYIVETGSCYVPTPVSLPGVG